MICQRYSLKMRKKGKKGRNYLLVFENGGVLDLEVKLGRGRNRSLQGDGQRIGDLAGPGQANRVLGPDPELVAPSWLEAAQGQFREGAKTRRAAHPMLRAQPSMLHQVADDRRATVTR